MIWMALLGRLHIRDKLVSCGMAVPTSYVLCTSGDETHDHMFFCALSHLMFGSYF